MKKIRIHCLTQILIPSPPFPGTSSSCCNCCCCCCCRCCCLRRRGREGGINADLFGVRSKQLCTNKAHRTNKKTHFVISLSLYSVDHWRSSKQGAVCPILSFLSGRSFMESVSTHSRSFVHTSVFYMYISFVYIPYTLDLDTFLCWDSELLDYKLGFMKLLVKSHLCRVPSSSQVGHKCPVSGEMSLTTCSSVQYRLTFS